MLQQDLSVAAEKYHLKTTARFPKKRKTACPSVGSAFSAYRLNP